MTNFSLPIKPVIAFLIVMDFSVATLPCPPPLLGDRRIILFCRYTVYGIWWWFWGQQHLVCEIPKKGWVEILDGWKVENAILSFKHGKLDNSKICPTPYIYINFGDFFRLFTSRVFVPPFLTFVSIAKGLELNKGRTFADPKNLLLDTPTFLLRQHETPFQKAIQKHNSWL